MDRLSELPDEVIIYILSFLKLKEAARTSVLSKRYRGHLWKFATSSLDFDDTSLQYIRKKSFFKTLPDIDRDRYVGWVHLVLRLHQAHTIDEFKAFIGFQPYNFQKVARGYYTLPTQIPHGYSLDSLTNLCLSYVEVTGKVLNYILSNCPYIEALHVESSASLVNLKLSRPLLKLKHLEILRCIFLKEIEISTVNLVSFKYLGHEIRLHLGDVPNLVDLIGLDNALGTIKEKKAKYPHQCLKMVELVGFVGGTLDMELALDVLNNALSLETIIIDTRIPFGKHISDPEKKLTAIARARQLETTLPPGIKMVIM
ncbi:hypothetical protein ACB092_04G185200 [Castanea dentata]